MKQKVNLGTEDGLKSFLYSIFVGKQIVLNNFYIQNSEILVGMKRLGSVLNTDVDTVKLIPGIVMFSVLADTITNRDTNLLILLSKYFKIKTITDVYISYGYQDDIHDTAGIFPSTFVGSMKIYYDETSPEYSVDLLPLDDTVGNVIIPKDKEIYEIAAIERDCISSVIAENGNVISSAGPDGEGSGLFFGINNYIKVTGTVEFIPKDNTQSDQS